MVPSRIDRIKILTKADGLRVEEKIWRKALGEVSADNLANIRHAAINGTAAWRLHVAEIADRVTCHVHRNGEELYEIADGAGVLFYAKIRETASGLVVTDIFSLPVKAGDVFIVPPDFAHQLVNINKDRLVILFACPDSHLGADRFILADIAS